MQGTNGNSAAGLVTLESLAKSTLRVHRADASDCMEFLGTDPDEVVLLEHPRGVFIRDTTGAIFGMTRYDVKVPLSNPPPPRDQRIWVLPAEEVKAALSHLRSGAAKEDNRLRFTRPTADGPVVLSMMSTTGSLTSTEVTLEETGLIDNAPEIPSVGFVVSDEDFEKALSAVEGDKMRFGVNVLPKGGYLRFSEVRFADATGENGDQYVSYIMWLR
jgi:hypothetical protein